MSICGNYVQTFAEASHALPSGMSMNADYPFMLPPVVAIEGDEVVLKGRDGDGRFRIHKDKNGRQYCTIAQKSTFETCFGWPPKKFWAYPFKDQDTPAAGLP